MVKPDSAPFGTARMRPELLDTKAAAAYLAIQPHTLEVWRVSGRYDLPFVRVGSRIRYRRDHLDRFLQSRTVGAQAEAK
jgi:hypothetical protein